MTQRQILEFSASRLTYGFFALATSFYCVLAYVPFTYIQFLQFPHLPDWLAMFAGLHHMLSLAALVLLTWILREDLKSPSTALLARGTLAFQLCIVLIVLYRPLLPNVANDTSSLVWAIVWLVPLPLIAVIDAIRHRASGLWSRGSGRAEASTDPERLLVPALLAAVFLPILYFSIAYVRYGRLMLSESGVAAKLFSAAWTTVSYAVLFSVLLVAVMLIRGLSVSFRNSARAEFLLCHVLAVVVLAAVLRELVFRSLSLDGPDGDGLALFMAVSLASYLAGSKLRWHALSGGGPQSGLALAMAPFAPGKLTSIPTRLAALGGIAVLAYVLAVRAALLDWNFLVQKLAVLMIWGLTLATFLAASPAPVAASPWENSRRRARLRVARTLFVAVFSLTGFVSLKYVRAADVGGIDADAALGQLAAYDVSLRLMDDILAPPVAEDDSDFYGFLQASTNISRAVKIDPVDIALSQDLESRESGAPHIFLFVVDSLRQDYVSPYNEAVGFTPNIGEFAQDGVVFRNAFTHYGATGLSQPSIWVGGMLLHQQYPQPFHPMNTLQKLLEAQDYESFISVDTIMRKILAPSESIVPLDTNTPDQSRDFCSTLEELEEKLGARGPAERPIFAFTQPQNIHISVLNRDGNSVVEEGDYEGFYAPYASRVQRMDTCFGGFVDFLQDAGLYENSIVILSSDHGDSLGEEGRWGHGYTIFPEVIQIPMVVRIPERMRQRNMSDPNAITFSTDITPSLYELLGKPIESPAPFFGRSLFAPSAQELAARSTAVATTRHLVVSSYGPVYGILEDNGRTLFLADAIDFETTIFDLSGGGQGERRDLEPSEGAAYEELVRAQVEAINAFYGFSVPQR